MSDKPIITVDVDASAFDRFRAKFNEYREAVKTSRKEWHKFGTDSGGAVENAFSRAARSGKPIGQQIKKDTEGMRKFVAVLGSAGTRQRAFNALAERGKSTLKTTAKWGGRLASSLANAVKSLLRIVTFGGVASGLLGAGGLFGLGRLSGSASALRREAQGFGIGSGDLRAARSSLGRYIDPESTLGGINEAQRDLSKRWTLSALGFNQREINQESPADLLPKLLPKLVQAFKAGGGTVQGAEARGLTQFADVSTLTRLSRLSDEELKAATARYEADRKALANTDETLRKWQDLDSQMTRAGQKIQAVFIDGLAPLAPQISKLSDAFSEWLKTFLKTPQFGEWIQAFAKGIRAAAEYLTSDEAQKDMQRFVTGIKALGEAVEGVLRFFGYLPKQTSQNGEPSKNSFREGVNNLKRGPNEPVSEWLSRIIYHEPLRPKVSVAQSLGEGEEDISARFGKRAANDLSPFERARADKLFTGLESKYRLPRGELDAVWATESSRGVNMLSSKGAQGHFGFMPKTQKEYGLRDPNDLEESARAAARKLSRLRAYYKGDDEKARAAYNWGEGNLDRLISKYSAAWKDHLPKETRDYLNKTNAIMPRDRTPATVVVYDNTGGNVTIQGGQLAY